MIFYARLIQHRADDQLTIGDRASPANESESAEQQFGVQVFG